MPEPAADWVKVRGMGRERFSGYFADYLTSLGFAVERDDRAEPAESRLAARLDRMNPAVPAAARELKFRFVPTSGGAAVVWELPTSVGATDRGPMDRFVRELLAHLERRVSTESHGTAKVHRTPNGRVPWTAGPM